MEWRGKRQRSESLSSESEAEGSMRSRTPSPKLAPTPKFHRGESPPKELLCTLPPTCSQPGKAQAFATQAELDAHQASLHQWVCRVPIRDKPGRLGEGQYVIVPEHFAGRSTFGKGNKWRECGKVFPEERLLDLVSCVCRFVPADRQHYTETHDPIARERQERGENIVSTVEMLSCVPILTSSSPAFSLKVSVTSFSRHRRRGDGISSMSTVSCRQLPTHHRAT